MDPRTDRYDCDILIRLISGLQIEIMISSDALPTTTRTSNVGTSAGQGSEHRARAKDTFRKELKDTFIFIIQTLLLDDSNQGYMSLSRRVLNTILAKGTPPTRPNPRLDSGRCARPSLGSRLFQIVVDEFVVSTNVDERILFVDEKMVSGR